MALALVVAAGSGERLGAGVPKALVEVGARPMLEWSTDVLLAVPSVDRVVVALPVGASSPVGTIGVAGGAARSDSVRAALDAAGPGDPVLVHDAARPLITPELVELVLKAVGLPGVDGAIAAAPMHDTVKRADAAGCVVQTLDRSELWAVQTPQAFRRDVLEAALSVAPEVRAQATDDAWLVERAGGHVVVVPWAQDNLKVTTPGDLRLVELLLERRAEEDDAH